MFNNKSCLILGRDREVRRDDRDEQKERRRDRDREEEKVRQQYEMSKESKSKRTRDNDDEGEKRDYKDEDRERQQIVENERDEERRAERRRRHADRDRLDRDRENDRGEKRSRRHEEELPPVEPPKKKKVIDELMTRTGGAYIPPAKLRMMQKDITDKGSMAFQRLAWEALKKSINGLINKVNISNIAVIVRELFKENLIRGRGLLCRSIMQAQAASVTFTNVYAAVVAVINTKFPNIGELLLKRLIIQFRRGYMRNDKPGCLAAAKFVAHLVNQQVAHEVVSLEILTLLLEHPTEDSVEG
jgi:pre-mRNA-splicing factor CWC22